jgi:galactokinase
LANIKDMFETWFSAPPDLHRFTPGRVNLIGEHTDYNGGWVFPTAVPQGLKLAMSARADDEIHILSDKFDKASIRSLTDGAEDHWSDYAVGAIKLANEAGFLSGGASIAVASDLPFGAGLSSSAAICVGLLKLARDLAGADMSDTDIAVLARRVENEFIGMPCGIMDQMAVAHCTLGTAIALDTDSLEFDPVSLPDDYHMAVIHSGHYRLLSEGRYKIRKEECDLAKEILGRTDLCRLTADELAGLEGKVSADVFRRTRHCMREHQRVLGAVKALRGGNITDFGRLMTESHKSMRDDFEISLPDIDRLVADAVKLGAVGARMTGGGFGGCIVACVAKDKMEIWRAALLAAHEEAFFIC